MIISVELTENSGENEEESKVCLKGIDMASKRRRTKRGITIIALAINVSKDSLKDSLEAKEAT